MKNKELLNICYKLFNRFITVNKMIEMLDNMDKKDISKEELKELDNLIAEIKKISKNIPNTEDEYVIKEKQKIKKLIDRFESLKDKNDFFNKQLEHLKRDYDKEMDSHERWFNVVDYINKNNYFNTCFDNLKDIELLEFIAQNIQAPFPPDLNQAEFEALVKVGIENDEREWLWRLALNYEYRNINFDSIIDYFIRIKDGYYITELIGAIGEKLDIDDIIDKITDKDLIKDIIDRKKYIEYFVKEEQFNKLISKLK